MSQPITFILNDETVANCYGFSIANNGIDLAQFAKNPVMLSDHWNNTNYVVGRWENIRISGSQLLADAVFDMEDENGKMLSGKVERGFLKACSMGIGFVSVDMAYVGDVYILTKCVLKEASIVAVPANANAVVLYDLTTNKLLTATDLQLQLSGLNTHTQTPIINMKQFLLSAAALVALSLSKQPETQEELDGSITKLKGDLEAAKAAQLQATATHQAALQAAKDELATLKTSLSKELLDTAIAEGKITADERKDYEALGLAFATAQLAKIPAKVTLGGGTAAGGSVTGAAGAEPKTFDELMKLSDADKDAFKAANPIKYKALVD